MNYELTDYEAAFDNQPPRRGIEASWAQLRRALRRHRRERQCQLVVAVVYTLGGVWLGIEGQPSGWGFAGHGILVAVPNRLRAYKNWIAESSDVEEADDVQALCADEAVKRANSIRTSSVVQGLLALTFLITGLTCLLIDRDPRPGLGAGAIVLAWVAFKVFALLPRAVREKELLRGE